MLFGLEGGMSWQPHRGALLASVVGAFAASGAEAYARPMVGQAEARPAPSVAPAPLATECVDEAAWHRLSDEQIVAMVDAGCDVRARTDDRRQVTMLWVAAWVGRPALMRALIARGADPRVEASGASVLRAAARGPVDGIDALIEAGVDVCAPDSDGMTALMEASMLSRADVAARLLARCPDVNAVAPSDGRTALHFAAQAGEVRRGAPPDPAPDALVSALVAAGADVNATTPNGRTPVFQAAQSGRLGVVAQLLDAGARADAVVDGRSVLGIALNRGHREVALLVASRRLGPATSRDLDAAWRAEDAEILTALGAPATVGEAARRCAVKVLAVALTAADPNAPDSHGDRPLHLAAEAGCAPAIAALRSAGADPTLTDADGRVPADRTESEAALTALR
jgi:ankyrin repeat protein